MKLGPIEFSESGVRIPRETTFADFERALQVLLLFRRQSPHWLGRMCLEGQRRFGDRFFSMLTTGDASLEDIHRLVGVCNKVSPSDWEPKLSMTHHQFAASLPPHLQASALQHAVDDGLNSGEFKNFCAELRRGM